MSARSWSGLLTRIATALVLLPVALVLVLVPPLAPGLALFVAAFACVGLMEYFRLAEQKEHGPERMAGIILGTIVTLSAGLGNAHLTAGTLAVAFVVISGLHVLHARNSLAALGTSFCGVIYVGWFPAHVLLLHAMPEVGRGLVLTLFAAVILTDVAAYFVGKYLGRHKLAPVVSPNKTWEGSMGGLVFSMGGLGALWALGERFGWNWLPAWSLGHYLMTGALLSIAAQIGDLMESSLKRDAGVKDSGTVFPGHGGVLDRCDGFLFAAPVLYYMALL